jgi:hypothetical protein
VPTGVIAIGQGATGVIAIGQLARGVVAFGQLAIGVVAFGQVALGLGWAGGMLSLGGVEGPNLLGTGTFGRLGFRSLVTLRWARFERYRPTGRHWRVLGVVVWLAVGAVVWFGVLAPLIDDLTRQGGILRDPPGPRVLR